MITDGAFTGNVERAADACRQARAFSADGEKKGGESKGNRWSLLLRSPHTGAIRRGGKSELRRAGWSVTRTVPGR